MANHDEGLSSATTDLWDASVKDASVAPEALSQRIREMRETASDLESEFRRQSERLHSLVTQNQNLRKSLEGAKNVAQARETHLLDRLRATRTEVERQHRAASELARQNSAYRAHLEQLTARLRDLERARAEAAQGRRDELEAAKQFGEDMRQSFLRERKAAAEAVAQSAAAERTGRELEARASELTTRTRELEAALQELQRVHAGQTQEIDKLRSGLHDASVRAVRSETEARTAAEREPLLVSAKTEALERLQRELEFVRAQAERAQTAVAEKSALIAKLEVQAGQLTRVEERLKEERKGREEAERSARFQIDQALADADAEISEVRARSERDLREARRRADDLGRELSDEKTRRADLERARQRAEADLARERARCEALEEELQSAAQARASSASTRTDAIRRELEESSATPALSPSTRMRIALRQSVAEAERAAPSVESDPG